MTFRIEYQSEDFPSAYTFPAGSLNASWSELLWAALTVGRPNIYHVFRHGPASFHEAIFRLGLVRMAVEENRWSARLQRTTAFQALDPTEKGMVSYFLGMTVCKLFASRLMITPWLLHLDVYRNHINAVTLGRSRPDLVGQDNRGRWHSFESKGRSSQPSANDKAKAKAQAQRILTVGGTRCSLHISAFTFFRSNELEFYWQDPEFDGKYPIEVPRPSLEWRYYYEPALSLAKMPEQPILAAERERADILVEIHPSIRSLLDDGLWAEAQERARELHADFSADGYQSDGIKVSAGESWSEPYEEMKPQ